MADTTAMDTLIADGFVDISGDGGLMKKVILEGTGAIPTNGSSIDCHYTGTFEDGKEFDR